MVAVPEPGRIRGDTVGGFTIGRTVSQTVLTSAYAAGDLIGNIQKIPGAVRNPGPGSGLIQSVHVNDVDAQDAALCVVFFDRDISAAAEGATTFTDGGGLDIADADLDKVIGVAAVSSYVAFLNNSVGQAGNLALPFHVEARDGIPMDLWFAIMAVGTPTYAGGNLSLKFGFLQD